MQFWIDEIAVPNVKIEFDCSVLIYDICDSITSKIILARFQTKNANSPSRYSEWSEKG